MKIHIPNSAFLGNLDPFLRGFDPSNPDRLEITTDQRWISLHPVAISMIAALGLTVDPARIRIQETQAKSLPYVVRMGLFDMLKVPCDIKITPRASEGRFIPLTQIRNSDESTRFVTEMIPMLHLHELPEHAKIIGHVISELVGNVLEHAGSPSGAVICAQYFPKMNCIRIGIADTGRGIKSSINRAHVADTNLEAIRLALWPGITGTSRKRLGGSAENAGAGLFIVKSIAKVNRDPFLIYSGDSFFKLRAPKKGRVRLFADPFEDEHSKHDGYPVWTGAVIGIDITLNQTQDFKNLLVEIGEVFYKLRTMKPARRRKPIFL